MNVRQGMNFAGTKIQILLIDFMRRNLILFLIPFVLGLSSCGTMSRFATQQYQDGVYSQMIDEPEPVHIMSRSEIEARAKAELAKKQMTKDTVYVMLDTPFAVGFGTAMAWSAWNWGWGYWDPWYWDRWGMWGPWGPWDPWYRPWGPWGPWDPWYRPWGPWGPYPGGYIPVYVRDHSFLGRRYTQPMRSQYGHFSGGSNMRYSSGTRYSGGTRYNGGTRYSGGASGMTPVRIRSGASYQGGASQSSRTSTNSNGNVRYNPSRAYQGQNTQRSYQQNNTRTYNYDAGRSSTRSYGGGGASYGGGGRSFGGGGGSFGGGSYGGGGGARSGGGRR